MLIIQLVWPASLESAYHLVVALNNKHGQGRLHEAFFECDRVLSCTHVIRFEDDGDYQTITDASQLRSVTDRINLWEKMRGKLFFVN